MVFAYQTAFSTNCLDFPPTPFRKLLSLLIDGRLGIESQRSWFPFVDKS